MTDQALAGPADPSCKLFQASQGRVSQGELTFAMPCLDLTGCGPELVLTGLGPTWLGSGLWLGRTLTLAELVLTIPGPRWLARAGP